MQGYYQHLLILICLDTFSATKGAQSLIYISTVVKDIF